MPERKMFKAKKELLKVAIVFLMASVFLLSLATVVFATSEPEFGNVSGGDKINVSDVVLVMRKALEMEELTFRQHELADVNNDGVINILDVTLIMRKALNLIDSFPVEDDLEGVDAIIFVNAEHGIVYGYFWPENAEVIVTIANFTETIEADGEGYFMLDSDDLDVQYGQTVIAKSGKLTKVHIVRPLALINTLNAEGLSAVQYVYGTASAGSEVRVLVFEEGVEEVVVSQNVLTGNDGEWIADFTEEEEDVDIADAIIDARIYDLTNDATIAFWVEEEE